MDCGQCIGILEIHLGESGLVQNRDQDIAKKRTRGGSELERPADKGNPNLMHHNCAEIDLLEHPNYQPKYLSAKGSLLS